MYGRRLKLAALGGVLLLLLVAHQTGILARLAHPEALRRSLLALGPWGYLAFLSAYGLLQPFGVPGTVFILAAPLIWPWPLAYALSLIGTMIASVLGFSFARFVARDWIRSRIPERLKKYEEALAHRSFATVFGLRFVFWMPPALHAFFGVSRVPFWTHFLASLTAYLLPLWLVSFFGQQLFHWLQSLSPLAWVSAGLALALAAFGLWCYRARSGERKGQGLKA